MTRVSPYERAERTSLLLHDAVAERLSREPELVEIVRRRVEGWIQDGSVSPPYAKAWKELLDEPLPRLLDALRERSERMHDLRQVSPFAGVLDPRTRWALRRAAAG